MNDAENDKIAREQVARVIAMQAGAQQRAQPWPPEWSAVFGLIEKAGGPRLSGFNKISFYERGTIIFNVWAFFFGPLYYVVKGMWKKAIFGLICGFLIIFGLIEIIGQDMAFTNFVIPAIFGTRANIDYYKKVVLNENGWF